jgi:hypothetical protein
VAASRPEFVAPCLHGAGKSPNGERSRFHDGGVIVERMAGQEEADRVELFLQPLGRDHGCVFGRSASARPPAAEQALLARLRLVLMRDWRGDMRPIRRKRARGSAPVRRKRRLRPGFRDTLVVAFARIDAAAKSPAIANGDFAARLHERRPPAPRPRPSPPPARSGSQPSFDVG